jgi:hypothetical protein
MTERIAAWLAAEPLTGLLIIIASVALFGFTLRRSEATSVAFWPWVRQAVEASAGVFLFWGLLWGFRVVLDHAGESFRSVHDQAVDDERSKAQAVWGMPLTQMELEVNHFIEREVQQTISREDKPPLYQLVKERHTVPQDSIVAFNGTADLTMSDPGKRARGEPVFNGYTIRASYEYIVLNNSEFETVAEFRFPLPHDRISFEDFKVIIDGQEFHSQLYFDQGSATWAIPMKPHQQSTAAITYTSRGLESFVYQIPVQREIRDFTFTLSWNTGDIFVVTEPEGDALAVKSESASNVGRLTWQTDRLFAAPKVGVIFVQPERPYAPYLKTIQTLLASPMSLTLLCVMLTLVLLLRQQQVRLSTLALFSAAYCTQFLVLAGINDILGFRAAFAVGALLAATMIFFLLYNQPSKLLRAFAYAFAAFFIAYPLSALLPDRAQRDSFDNIVRAGIVVCLFGLSLYSQLEAKRNRTTSLTR